jgi:uncharacterized protein YcbK (DUF882 family)
MGDLSKHFSRAEFACQCGCGFDTVDVGLIEVLEDIRRHWNAAVTINSSARCLTHNKNIGSTDSSQHTKGRAADIVVRGVDPVHVYEYLDQTHSGALGLGSYKDFTHIDTRNSRSRWSA